MLDLLLITIITVLIVDISGFIDTIKYIIGKILTIKNYKNIRLKPFDCSFCMNFWLSLIYIFSVSNITLFNICFILTLSFFADTIKDIFILIKDILIKINSKIYTTFNL